MTSEKHKGRVLGLLAMTIVGLMAAVTPGAQANWTVEGSELTANETVEISLFSPFVLSVAKINLEIKCTTGAGENFKLTGKSGTADGKIKFSGCTTYSPIGSGKENKNCKPKEPIVFTLKSLLILHNGINYILHEATTEGGKLATIEFSELCALAETADLTGSTVLECGHLNPPNTWLILDCASEESPKLSRTVSSALFMHQIFLGSLPVVVADHTSTRLSGANANRKWGGII